MKGRFPDITQAQVLAALTWIATQAVAAGWVDNDQAQHWLQLGSSLLAGVWIIADAVLRGMRNVRVGMEAKANAIASLPPADRARHS